MFTATNTLHNISSSQIYMEMERLSFLKTELKLKRRLLRRFLWWFNFTAQMLFSSLSAPLYLNHVKRNIFIKHCVSELETK